MRMFKYLVKLLKENEMIVTVEKITPAKAILYLNKNPCNRILRTGIVERYAADMLKGNWTECTDPITFYEDGEIADGQHRLFAIIESNTTQTFIVARELPRDAGLNIDTGLPRSLIDNAKISGKDLGLTTTMVAAARAVEEGDAASKIRNGALSNTDLLTIVEKHREATEWAIAHGPVGKGLRNAIVLAAIARAWYVEKDKEKLSRYSQVLSKGFANGPSESAAVAMRNYIIMKHQAGTPLVSNALWRDTFLKVQSTIRNFMLGKPVSMVRVIADETYPLVGGSNKKHVPTTRAGKVAVTKAVRASKKSQSLK